MLPIKQDFPIFKNNPDLIYLDSAATSLKPKSVIDALCMYYEKYSANVGRAIYKLSQDATQAYEDSRSAVAEFISADPDEIVFTRNTTESLNLLAYTLGKNIKPGDKIVTSIMEHHSNFVPWQQLAKQKKAQLNIIDIDDEGRLDLSNLQKLITQKTKIVTLTYVSNVLGTINPIASIIKKIKQINPKTTIIIDAAQAVSHIPINVKRLGADFIAFSAHKMFGPTGVGILWGKKEKLINLPPYLFGGEMIEEVNIKNTTFKDPPYKFEAGTPSITEIIVFKQALSYIQKIGFENIQKHEQQVIEYALHTLQKEFKNNIKILGTKNIKQRIGVLTFSFAHYHPHDISQILDEDHICVRSGHHCAMPLHTRLKLPASTRASFHIYNSYEDVDKLVAGLKKVEKILQ
ncbi:SufS family cysteine desulfurase [Patescibacteria group bacterium AH-259-L07]|nr:SufS family cysteine desulfurase [Patescibacteria group bacterium AH-259-L07]